MKTAIILAIVLVAFALLACGPQLMVEPMLRPTADIPAIVCVVSTAAAQGGNTK
jgi:DNA-binding PucR family transcriptional regulator